MSLLKEKKKSTASSAPIIEIILALAVVAFGVMLALIFKQTGNDELSARIDELDGEIVILGEEIAKAENERDDAAKTAKALMEIEENRHQDLTERKAELTAEKEQLELALNDLRTLPERIEKARRDYAAAINTLERMIMAGESTAKIAYLTFDDGPYGITDDILDTLAEYDAKATFFVIGRPKYADTIRRELLEGHMVANHTYSHGIGKGLYKSVDSFIEQVDALDQMVYQETGLHTEIVRFPGGSNTAGSLKEEMKGALVEKGYGWINWDASVGDATAGSVITSETEMGNLKSTVKSKGITVILMHDFSKITRNTLPQILEYLQGKGYTFLPLFYESVKVNK